MTSKGTRTFLAVVAGLAVLYFGSDGSDDNHPTSGVFVLALAAAVVVWHLTRPQNSEANNSK